MAETAGPDSSERPDRALAASLLRLGELGAASTRDVRCDCDAVAPRIPPTCQWPPAGRPEASGRASWSNGRRGARPDRRERTVCLPVTCRHHRWMSADPEPGPGFAPDGAAGYEPHRWASVVRELVRLRREETASDLAAEAATVDELHRALRGLSESPLS